MAPRDRHSTSVSITSSTVANTAADAINGGMLAPATSGSKSASPVTTRKSRSRSTASLPGFPAAVIPKRVEPPRRQLEPAKLAVAVVLSTVLEAGLQTAASTIGTGDLAAISKRPDTWLEILGLLGWKVAKLSLCWLINFDAYDVAGVSLLLSTPTSILLGLFYKISPLTLLTTNLSSLLANSIPYVFLRPLSPSHAPGSAAKSSVRNRSILMDHYTTIATSLLATAIFAVLLEASFATFLPQWLVTHFTGLHTLEPAHLGASGLPTLLLALIPAGVACMTFLFAPSTAVPNTAVPPPFDPVTASFAQHVYYNAWGWYSARQKELIGRTALLMGLMLTECALQLWATIAGVEFYGALGYAGVWALGVIVVGVVLDWVGGPSD
ncbi:uncharacterized protein Z518_04160 [Rhinocladiella mackenziei CBS 650.93]|uniref:Rhinocladiella mackenziei CBS 650.93 unplaced genomic scaffold supercont1.3, whole genome shotgun sequence n=1 Tax=Rhinocladiella mackenziei CBS 650.93 TaxID=1442369 RepID=A0A0D2ISP5_9EURO|nr:uncharacterized protein Z518_04160 [Rhinocladiella mackenziei CBS 650.93]KIX06186.1 hypothetical protein Z518_04160 [Rhinocladiella mackenziei CBS 650.93]